MTGWELRPLVTPSLQDGTKLEKILPWPAWEQCITLHMCRVENTHGLELGPVWPYPCIQMILFVFRSVFKKKKRPHWLGNNILPCSLVTVWTCFLKYYVYDSLLSFFFLVRWTAGYFILSRSNTVRPLKIFCKISHWNWIRFRCMLSLQILNSHYSATGRYKALFWWKFFKKCYSCCSKSEDPVLLGSLEVMVHCSWSVC